MSVGLKLLAFCAALPVPSCSPGSGREQPGESALSLDPTGDSAAVCFESDQSVLARARNSAAPGPGDLRGWLRLERYGAADSAGAMLVDSDGFALGATWRRGNADSIEVAGFNDFVRIDIRLRQSDSGARGSLRASSDAALERDSSGTLHEFRRASSITFRRAPCDRMPVPVGVAAIDVLPHGTPRPGVRFDPSTLERGGSVGAFTVDSIVARRVPNDTTYVGMARFTGTIELNGWTFRHPDPDLRRVLTCFEADPSSAARLPRWSGDERRAWFCFSNRAEAARALGPPSEGVPVTIVVDQFTIHRGLSDEVNSARFVRIVRRRTGDVQASFSTSPRTFVASIRRRSVEPPNPSSNPLRPAGRA